MPQPPDRRPGGRRLWIVNHYADPPDRPSGTRHFDLARRLVVAGDDVTIFASGVSHVTGREERLRGWGLLRRETFDGVRFAFLRTVPYRGNGPRRSLNMLSFAALLVPVSARFPRPDAVVGSTVHPFAALAAWLVARARRARFVYEIRDLWPQTLVDLDAMRVGSPGERLLRAIESFLVRHADAVVTLLPGVVYYLRERGLPSDHVVTIPNGVDLVAFDRAVAEATAPGTGTEVPANLAAVRAAIDRRRAEGRLVIGYVGAFGRVNDVPTIVRAAALAEARAPGRVAVVLVGDGPERPEVERAIEASSAAGERPPVDLVAPIVKTRVPPFLAAIDVGLVHATATATYRYGISFNKLFEYLAAGRPVLFGCESAYDPVATAGAGLTVPPGDAERMADAMVRLAELGPDERARMGRAGRAVVERDHDIARLAERLAAILSAPGAQPDGLPDGASEVRG